jgi:hypothetical protein
MVGARETGRPGSDYADLAFPLARRARNIQLAIEKNVAQETLDRMNGHGLVEEATVTVGFARVMTNAAGHGGHGVFPYQQLYGLMDAPLPQEVHVSLDVDADRASGVARCHPVLIERPDVLPRSRLVDERRRVANGDRRNCLALTHW